MMGKVTLIVGGASGIGRATAEVFAREGAQLIIADINTADGKALTDTLGAYTRSVFLPVDVSQSSSVQEMVRLARQTFTRIHCLVISSGISEQAAPIHQLPEEEFDRVIAVNLRGPFLIMKYIVPWLLESGGGSIVIVGSAAGMVGAPMLPAYCSSKGGVIQMARVAAIDYATAGIRVNSICPGAIDTPLFRWALEHRPRGVPGLSTADTVDNLVNRVGNPYEVAEAILFLCSDRAPFIIGSELVIDGGKLTR
jgi:NAD(P)-dependent dehydrogenase (short-subunit alcohol dehydrogenase family)